MVDMRSWTKDEIETVRKKFIDDEESDGEIAHYFGVSKSTIIGLRHRRNIFRAGGKQKAVRDVRQVKTIHGLRVTEGRMGQQRKREDQSPPLSVGREPEVSMPTEILQMFVGTGEIGISIYELRKDTCRWPLGEWADHPPYRYCGEFSDGKTYCAAHSRINKWRPSGKIEKQDRRMPFMPK